MTICILIFLFACLMETISDCSRTSDYHAERRHEELMEYKKRSTRKRVTRRRYLRDEKGRFISEELIVDDDNDEDED